MESLAIRGDLSTAMFSVALRADDTLVEVLTEALIINSILVRPKVDNSLSESRLVNGNDRFSITPPPRNTFEANIVATIDL